MPTFAPVIKNDGAIAQLVEQRTENPCVPGSIPGGTTSKKIDYKAVTNQSNCFFYILLCLFRWLFNDFSALM